MTVNYPSFNPMIDYGEENNRKIIKALHRLYKLGELKIEIKSFEEITGISISNGQISIGYIGLRQEDKIIREGGVTLLKVDFNKYTEVIYDTIFSKFPTEEEREKTRKSVDSVFSQLLKDTPKNDRFY